MPHPPGPRAAFSDDPTGIAIEDVVGEPARRLPSGRSGRSASAEPAHIGIALAAGAPMWRTAGGAARVLERAERDGFDSVWIEARPPAADCDVIQCAAMAAALTSTIRIAVFDLAWPAPSWLRTAEDLATLDAVSGGRIEVVLRPTAGSDESNAELEAMEDLELLRRAWDDQPIDHASARHNVESLDVHPKPAQSGGPPIWISDRGGNAAFAVRIAVGSDVGLVAESREAADAYSRAWGDPAPPTAARPRLALRGRGVLEYSGGDGHGALVGRLRSRAELAREHLAGVGPSLDWFERVRDADPDGGVEPG